MRHLYTLMIHSPPLKFLPRIIDTRQYSTAFQPWCASVFLPSVSHLPATHIVLNMTLPPNVPFDMRFSHLHQSATQTSNVGRVYHRLPRPCSADYAVNGTDYTTKIKTHSPRICFFHPKENCEKGMCVIICCNEPRQAICFSVGPTQPNSTMQFSFGYYHYTKRK